MRLLGLYRVSFDILDRKWRQEFRNTESLTAGVLGLEVGVQIALKILLR
jgi:hypothetical protein